MNPHENAWQLFDYMSLNPFKTGRQLEHYHWVKDKDKILIWPNRIYDITPNLPDVIIDEIADKIITNEYPSEIQFRLDGKQKSNIDHFIRKGFKVLREFPALSIGLNKDKIECLLPQDWDLSIRQVSNEQGLADWSNLLGNGFWSDKVDVSKPLHDIYEAIYKDNDKLKLFIAYINDIPAATSMAFNASVGGGIYLVYVKAEYRRHSLGALITKEAEQWCFKKGHKRVILQATAMGEPVYKRMGYKTDFNYLILVPV